MSLSAAGVAERGSEFAANLPSTVVPELLMLSWPLSKEMSLLITPAAVRITDPPNAAAISETVRSGSCPEKSIWPPRLAKVRANGASLGVEHPRSPPEHHDATRPVNCP